MSSEKSDLASLKAAYEERGGGYWFEPDTMRFFDSKIHTIHEVADGTFVFVTSEEPPHGERQWSVRQLNLDGNIETVGAFCSMPKDIAETRAAELAGVVLA